MTPITWWGNDTWVVYHSRKPNQCSSSMVFKRFLFNLFKLISLLEWDCSFYALLHGHRQLKTEITSLQLWALCDIMGKWKSGVQWVVSMSTGSEAFLKHLKWKSHLSLDYSFKISRKSWKTFSCATIFDADLYSVSQVKMCSSASFMLKQVLNSHLFLIPNRCPRLYTLLLPLYLDCWLNKVSSWNITLQVKHYQPQNCYRAELFSGFSCMLKNVRDSIQGHSALGYTGLWT